MAFELLTPGTAGTAVAEAEDPQSKVLSTVHQQAAALTGADRELHKSENIAWGGKCLILPGPTCFEKQVVSEPLHLVQRHSPLVRP